jgi:hypothetical protein
MAGKRAGAAARRWATQAATLGDGVRHLALAFALKGTPQAAALSADPSGWPRQRKGGCRVALAVAFGGPLALLLALFAAFALLSLPWGVFEPNGALSVAQARAVTHSLHEDIGQAAMMGFLTWMAFVLLMSGGAVPWNWRAIATAGFAAPGRERSAAWARAKADASLFRAWGLGLLANKGVILRPALAARLALLAVAVGVEIVWISQKDPSWEALKKTLSLRASVDWAAGASLLNLTAILFQVTVVSALWIGAKALARAIKRATPGGAARAALGGRWIGGAARGLDVAAGMVLPIGAFVAACQCASMALAWATKTAIATAAGAPSGRLWAKALEADGGAVGAGYFLFALALALSLAWETLGPWVAKKTNAPVSKSAWRIAFEAHKAAAAGKMGIVASSKNLAAQLRAVRWGQTEALTAAGLLAGWVAGWAIAHWWLGDAIAEHFAKAWQTKAIAEAGANKSAVLLVLRTFVEAQVGCLVAIAGAMGAGFVAVVVAGGAAAGKTLAAAASFAGGHRRAREEAASLAEVVEQASARDPERSARQPAAGSRPSRRL